MSDEQVLRERAMRFSVDVFVSLAVIVLIGYMAIGIIAPFFSVIVWAAIMAVGAYPGFLWLRGRMGGRGGAAATVLALVGLVVLITPTILVVDSIISTVGPVAQAVASGEARVPPPGEGVKDWPLIGPRVHEAWTAASVNFRSFAETHSEQITGAARTVLSLSAGLIGGVAQFALSIVFAAVFMCYADPLVRLADRLAARIASHRGSAMLLMAARTARNVTRGVIGVAVIQGGLGALGVLAVGMPFAGVVAALLVVSTLVQVPVLVIVPTIIWAWSAEPTLTAVLFTAWMIPVMLSDNVLKPVLMARGLETPMVVILIGVVGGTVSGGLLGLFTGPVILAVFHKMVTTWIERVTHDAAEADAPPPDPAPPPEGAVPSRPGPSPAAEG